MEETPRKTVIIDTPRRSYSSGLWGLMGAAALAVVAATTPEIEQVEREETEKHHIKSQDAEPQENALEQLRATIADKPPLNHAEHRRRKRDQKKHARLMKKEKLS